MKYGEAVMVSDDSKYWRPALILGYDPKRFYAYKVKVGSESEPIWYSQCKSVKEYEKERTMELVSGFYKFLNTIPKGIRGTMDNQTLINKYLGIQREMILQGFIQHSKRYNYN